MLVLTKVRDFLRRYNLSRLAAPQYDSGNAPYSKYLTLGVKKRGTEECEKRPKERKQEK